MVDETPGANGVCPVCGAAPSQLVEDARRYRAIRPFDAPDEHEDRYVVIKLNGKRTTFYNGSALDAAADAIAKGVES